MAVGTPAAALTLSATLAVPSIMGAFIAKPADIATGSAHPQRLAELRRGEIIAASLSIALAGLLASSVNGPERKLILGATGIMILVYLFEAERALRVSPFIDTDTES